VLTWFRRHNADKPYKVRTRPFGFFNSPTVRPFDTPIGEGGNSFHLVAPYESDATKWLRVEYTDIYSGEAFRITTGMPAIRLAKVQTYVEHAQRYLHHPDPKRLGTDGRPCTRRTRRSLSSRHIDAFHVEQIGKETNRLEEVEVGLIHDAATVYTSYEARHRDPWMTIIVPALAAMPLAVLAGAGILGESALRETRRRAKPHTRHRARLVALATTHARKTLEEAHTGAPLHPLAAIHLATTRLHGDRGCEHCGAALESARATSCLNPCRQAAYRDRGRNRD
jgi:hypothetical protein